MKLDPNFGVEVLSENVPQGFVRSVNYKGAGVSVNKQGNTVDVTISGGAGGGPVSVSVVAADILSAFDPVTVLGNKADSGNTAHFGKVIGLAQAAAAIGFSVVVVVEGLLQNPAWSWTGGSPIFLNGTSLSQTPPGTGFIQQIGVAKASDTIYVDLPAPIKL